ncbi:hypothetical protein, variant [Phytophthora nicotianae]|uniref:Uncharacterized protein n=1 Tax=Phytophthora nicotianae TaxID=4792 RepID=W2FZK7_PHYNI|nr:hypothetical protein L915_17405 [Phytophthora nicotianae]ETK76100.1 hypothetical protein, variant [Phytophthora nicotianae]
MDRSSLDRRWRGSSKLRVSSDLKFTGLADPGEQQQAEPELHPQAELEQRRQQAEAEAEAEAEAQRREQAVRQARAQQVRVRRQGQAVRPLQAQRQAACQQGRRPVAQQGDQHEAGPELPCSVQRGHPWRAQQGAR